MVEAELLQMKEENRALHSKLAGLEETNKRLACQIFDLEVCNNGGVQKILNGMILLRSFRSARSGRVFMISINIMAKAIRVRWFINRKEAVIPLLLLEASGIVFPGSSSHLW